MMTPNQQLTKRFDLYGTMGHRIRKGPRPKLVIPNKIEKLNNGTIRIKLNNKLYAIIDEADYDKVKKFRWHASFQSRVYYATTNITRINEGCTTTRMHRFILPCRPGFEIDHIDHNGLNNTKNNLRLATRSQNNMNKRLQGNNSTGYAGISWSNRDRRWKVEICVDKKKLFLGSPRCFKKALSLRNEAKKKYFGEFASVNEGYAI